MKQTKSQKALGIKCLEKQSSFAVPALFAIINKCSDEQIKKKLEQLNKNTKLFSETYFLRTCPEKPRPGVFESKKVKREKIKNEFSFIKEFFEKEPNGSIVIQQYLPAQASCVVAPHRYAIFGENNNGVTAGYGKKIILPVVEGLLEYFLVDNHYDTDKVEVEFVHKGNYTYVTQIRESSLPSMISSPPSSEAISGFIPEGDLMIEEIETIQSDEDLLKLEQLKKEKGLIVVHPKGNLLSHVSAHCRSLQVAYACPNDLDKFLEGCKKHSRWIESSPGWIVPYKEGIKNKTYNLNEYEEQFLVGVEYARMHVEEQWSSFGIFFHQFIGSPMNCPEVTAFLGGCYVGWLIFAGITSCVGEIRHNKYLNKELFQEIFTYYESRSDIYHYMFSREFSWDYLRIVAHITLEFFNFKGWAGGYGGFKWAMCTKRIIDLLDTVQKRDILKIIQKANLLENSMHNNGWFYNKHKNSKLFFDIATNGLLDSQIGFGFFIFEHVMNITKLKTNRNSPSMSLDELLKTCYKDDQLILSLSNIKNQHNTHGSDSNAAPTHGIVME